MEEKGEILNALDKGNFNYRGYDGETVVTMAVEYGNPEYLEKVLTRLESMGAPVQALAHSIDNDGFSAVYFARDKKALREVMERHGISFDGAERHYGDFREWLEKHVDEKASENPHNVGSVSEEDKPRLTDGDVALIKFAFDSVKPPPPFTPMKGKPFV